MSSGWAGLKRFESVAETGTGTGTEAVTVAATDTESEAATEPEFGAEPEPECEPEPESPQASVEAAIPNRPTGSATPVRAARFSRGAAAPALPRRRACV